MTASVSVCRLAAAILIELNGHVARRRVLVAADDLIEEIDDEDDGLKHASEAIASLLRLQLLCAEEQVELPNSELQSAAVGILAPPLAQHVRTRTRGGAAKPATPS
jgi:hypothetical protein